MAFQLTDDGALRVDLVKASVEDGDLFRTLEPRQVMAYLLGTGWHEQHRELNGHLGAWRRGHQGGYLWLPNSRLVADYNGRMKELLAGVARAEGRTQLTVACGLLGVAGHFGKD